MASNGIPRGARQPCAIPPLFHSPSGAAQIIEEGPAAIAPELEAQAVARGVEFDVRDVPGLFVHRKFVRGRIVIVNDEGELADDVVDCSMGLDNVFGAVCIISSRMA